MEIKIACVRIWLNASEWQDVTCTEIDFNQEFGVLVLKKDGLIISIYKEFQSFTIIYDTND